MRLGVVLVGRYDDAIQIQSRQPENEMSTDGYVVLAGNLASLGRTDEAGALVKRGLARFPGLLSIERFALNRSWSPGASVLRWRSLPRKVPVTRQSVVVCLVATESSPRMNQRKGETG